jgi:hypothetical protein
MINEELFLDMKDEMQGIKEVFVNFLKKYPNILTELPGQEFKEEFEKIGVVLVHRIELEEDILYKMYLKA